VAPSSRNDRFLKTSPTNAAAAGRFLLKPVQQPGVFNNLPTSLETGELSATAATYDDALTELEGACPRVWRTLHIRANRD